MAAWHQLIRIVRRLCVPSRLGLAPGGFAYRTTCSLGPPIPTDGQPSFPRPSITQTGKYRNINLSSIGCALRPCLRIRLTLGGRTCPRNPWIFGGRDSHPPYRYSCLHGHSSAVHRSFRPGFDPRTTLSYHSACAESVASVPSLVPFIFGAESLDQ